MTIKGKKIQFSKLITAFILVLITIAWIRALILFWDEKDYFNILLDYTQAMFLAIAPYCMLSMTDRLVYMKQAENQNEGGAETYGMVDE
jgi:hypothetical protein